LDGADLDVITSLASIWTRITVALGHDGEAHQHIRAAIVRARSLQAAGFHATLAMPK
jgi:hypothetical protein